MKRLGQRKFTRPERWLPTNFLQHFTDSIVQLGYDVSKNWGTGFTWYSFERDEDYATAKEDQVDIYQFNVSYKF